MLLACVAVTGLQVAPGLVDSLAVQIKAVHGGQDPDAPGRLLEPFVVARRERIIAGQETGQQLCRLPGSTMT